MSHFYWLKLGVSIHVIPENSFKRLQLSKSFFLIHKVSAEVVHVT